MKQSLYLLGIFVLILNLFSCKDCYYIENDLHGVWQVTSVERLSTGEITEPTGNLLYMFQRSMVMLGYKHLGVPEGMTRYIAHFDLVNVDSIGMGEFRNYSTGEGGSVNQEFKIPLGHLHKFGLFQDYTMFHMSQSRKELTLKSDSSYIVLRRY